MHWPFRTWSRRRLVLAGVVVPATLLLFFAAFASAAGPQALILGSTVFPGTATDGSGVSLEQQQAQNDGFTVTVVDDATWSSMTAAQFAAYQVIIIGDPSCGATVGAGSVAASNAAVWEPVVMGSGGNKVLIGTDPTFHNTGPSGTQRGDVLEANGIAFAGAVPGATGAYIDVSCTYSGSPPGTAVPILDGLSTHGTGQFTTGGAPCAGSISIVASSGPTSGLHDADLSNWGCSVHEFFDTFPSDYTPLALATDPSVPQTYSATDVDTGATVSGSPYIMVSGSGVTVSSDISLAPPTQTLPLSTSATLTATVTNGGVPEAGKTVTFTVDSGPNTGATGTGVTDSAGHTTFTYPDSGGAGTDGISATFVNDAGAAEKATATVTWSATATDPAITAAGVSGFSATVGAAATGTVATFTDPDAGGTAADYSATINWGDGNTSAGTVSGSGGSFTVSGTNTYASSGSFTITTAITDTDGSANTATATAVASGAPTIVVLGTPVVHSSTGADLSGTVNPDELPTSAFFQYGLDARYRGKGASGIVYDQSTPVQAIGSDFSAHAISASVSGLVPNALYHVRLVTSNASRTVFGSDQRFMTAQDPAPHVPVLGKEVNVRPVSGLVFIRPAAGKSLAHVSGAVARAALAKGQGFVPLTEARQIPTGSQIDARQGSLQVTTASVLRRGKPQIGTFGGGVFKITQARSRVTKGLSTLTLLEGLFRGAPSYASCRATAHGASLFPSAQAARLSRAVLQTLRANVHGHFRARGRYSAGVSRGTNWTTRDQCNGTLTIVHRGTVAVRDFARRKTILVHAGQRYLAKP